MGNGTLYIDGKGDMPDYRDRINYYEGPWYDASYVNDHKILKVLFCFKLFVLIAESFNMFFMKVI